MKWTRHEQYDSNLSAAQEFQDFVQAELAVCGITIGIFCSRKYQWKIGESVAGYEVKLDRKYKTTGNLYIETEERPSGAAEWKPSGPFHKDNAWMIVQGDFDKFWVFPCSTLVLCSRLDKFAKKEGVTARGFLLPVECADKYAAKVVIPTIKRA